MFSPETLRFLAENRGMNSKAWFEAHRKEYDEYVQEPMRELAEKLVPVIAAIDEQIIVSPLNKSISRIWCDVRFSHGMLYRESQWLSFKRDKREFERYPEFFVVFSPREFFYGCGYYCASANSMEAARRLIMEEHGSFVAARKVVEGQSRFVNSGDTYKRSRYPQYSDDLRNWLDRKNFCFTYCADVRELFDVDLAEKLKVDFKTLQPLYDFFITAENMSFM